MVSLQTLAGYQNALSRIINPRLGGLRLTEARTGVVDEALTRVDLSGRTTRVARSVLAQMFAMAVRHDALTANPMREVRRAPRRRRAVQALTVEQARDLLRLTASHQRRCCSRRARPVAGWYPANVRPARRGASAAGHGDAHRRGAGSGVGRPRPGRRHPVRTGGRHHGRAPSRAQGVSGIVSRPPGSQGTKADGRSMCAPRAASRLARPPSSTERPRGGA